MQSQSEVRVKLIYSLNMNSSGPCMQPQSEVKVEFVCSLNLRSKWNCIHPQSEVKVKLVCSLNLRSWLNVEVDESAEVCTQSSGLAQLQRAISLNYHQY